MHPLQERLLQPRHVPRVSDGTLVVDSKWRTGNPADRAVPLANGAARPLHRSAHRRAAAPPGQATNVVILGNYCDPWPYEDELP